MLKRYGSLKYVRARTQGFVTDSVRALGPLKEGEVKQALIETLNL